MAPAASSTASVIHSEGRRVIAAVAAPGVRPVSADRAPLIADIMARSAVGSARAATCADGLNGGGPRTVD
jgi:hypothetical protein